MGNTAVLYSRVSTTDQDYQSQFDDLQKWAESNNYNVLKTFGEKVSGYDPNADRIAYNKMKQYILDNGIEHIICWEISRLGRSTVKTLSEIEYWSAEGVNIFFKKENMHTIEGTATNKAILAILSSLAEMERDNIVSRTVRGLYSEAIPNTLTNLPFDARQVMPEMRQKEA